MAKNAVTDEDKGWRRAKASLSRVARGKYVVVGVRGARGAEVPEGADLTLAQIAAVNEFGSADGHVPERSFLRSTIDRNKGRYADAMTDMVTRITEGSDIDHELGLLGVRVAADVVRTINAGVAPPNAPSTIRRKKSDHTLINHGRLRQSIDSEVRET